MIKGRDEIRKYLSKFYYEELEKSLNAEQYFLKMGEKSLKNGKLLRGKCDFEIVLQINPENKLAKNMLEKISQIFNDHGTPKSPRDSKRMLERHSLNENIEKLGKTLDKLLSKIEEETSEKVK